MSSCWPSGAWSALVALLVMPFALLLAVSGVSTPNPTAVGVPPETLEQADTVRGILRITRHPLMWGIALWALAHVVANGDLASFVMFGGFAALALVGTLMLDRKYAARRGAEWQRFADASSNLPLEAIVQGRQSLVFAEIGWARNGGGAPPLRRPARPAPLAVRRLAPRLYVRQARPARGDRPRSPLKLPARSWTRTPS